MANWHCFVLYFALATWIFHGSDGEKNNAALARLKRQIFDGYDMITPVKDREGQPQILVWVELLVYRILDIDAPSQTLSLTGQFRVKWRDENLMWNETEWGISHIVVRGDEVWKPEISVMNSVTQFLDQDWDDKFRVRIDPNGMMKWTPGGRIDVSCVLDTYAFPFDHQTCQVAVNSLVSDARGLLLLGKKVNFGFYEPSGEWNILANMTFWGIRGEWVDEYGKKIYDEWDEEKYIYSEAVFVLILVRNPEYYVLNVLLPCFMLCLLSSLVFLVPADAGEKISLVLTMLLSFTVFLMIIADELPHATLTRPLFSVYLNILMFLNGVALISTVFLLNQHHKRPLKPVPTWIRLFVLKFLAVPFGNREWKHCLKLKHGCRKNRDNAEGDEQASDATETKNNLLIEEGNNLRRRKQSTIMGTDEQQEEWAHDWAVVARVLDRFFFFVYLFVLTMVTILFLVYPLQSDMASLDKYKAKYSENDAKSN